MCVPSIREDDCNYSYVNNNRANYIDVDNSQTIQNVEWNTSVCSHKVYPQCNTDDTNTIAQPDCRLNFGRNERCKVISNGDDVIMDGASASHPPDDGFHEHKAQHLSREGPPGHGIPVTKTNYLACQYFKQRCRINEHVIRDGSSFRCEECEAGKFRDGGDLVESGLTYCEAVTCQVNQRVVNHECVGCPTGKINDAGDTTDMDDTFCEDEICIENHRVVGNTCVPCPNGTYRPLGDNATGPDTTCNVILCDENEYVKDSTVSDIPTAR